MVIKMVMVLLLLLSSDWRPYELSLHMWVHGQWHKCYHGNMNMRIRDQQDLIRLYYMYMYLARNFAMSTITHFVFFSHHQGPKFVGEEPPPGVKDQLLMKFAERKGAEESHQRSYVLSSRMKDKILSHLFVLVLIIDDFVVDCATLQQDLKLTTSKLVMCKSCDVMCKSYDVMCKSCDVLCRLYTRRFEEDPVGSKRCV